MTWVIAFCNANSTCSSPIHSKLENHRGCFHSQKFSASEGLSLSISWISTFTTMLFSCRSSIMFVVESSCLPYQASFTFKILPEPEAWILTWMVLTIFLYPREVKHLFTCLQACLEAALLILWLTNQESWLANPNKAITLGKRHNSPGGN